MKKNWMQIVTLCLCAVLLAVTIVQAARLEEYLQLLENRIDNLSQSLSNEIQHISNSIGWELEEANRAVSDHALEPVGIDPENHALLADVTVTLKEWYEDTGITLLAEVGEKQVSQPMTADGSGTFGGRVSIPLEGDAGIDLTALISGGGLTRQEELGGWGDISMLLPLRSGGGGWSGPEYQDGVMTSDFSILIEGPRDGAVTVENPEYWIYRNGELVQTLRAVCSAGLSADGGSSYTVDTGADWWSLECEPGDVIEIRFRCEDEFGLGYDFLFQTWTVPGETGEDEIISGADWSGAELKLYWPE